MSSDREREIESCLAYIVLRDPDEWIGAPCTSYLDAFLHGVEIRRDVAGPFVADGRISGVLNQPEFYQQCVEATGHPALTIRWSTAIALTDLSLAKGFTKLEKAAIAWHREHGLDPAQLTARSGGEASGLFWEKFARRPAMYLGDHSGWCLYCFFNGMEKGGDWLGLHPMPRLDVVFGGIKETSKRSYGSEFGAFRVCGAHELLKWGGLCEGEALQ